MWLKTSEYMAVDDFRFEINGKRVVVQDIKSLEVRWQLSELYTIGEAVFIDSIGIIEHTKMMPHQDLKISWKDATGETFNQTFYVTNIQDVRAEKGQVVGLIRFIDKNIINFINTFESKGFPNGDIKLILDYYVNKYKVDKSFDNQISSYKYGNETNPGNPSQAVPGDRSLANLIEKWSTDADFIFYQERKKITCTCWNKLLSKSCKGEPLIIQGQNLNYVGRVGDMLSDTADSLTANIIMPNIEQYYMKHLEGKKHIIEPYSYTDARSESGGPLGSKVVEWVKPNDTKNIAVRRDKSKKFKYTYKKYVNNMQILEVITPGDSTREVGDVMKVMFQSHELNEELDENLVGKWLVAKITDKITMGYLTQKLTLIRS
jgi:hypothetical protein